MRKKAIKFGIISDNNAKRGFKTEHGYSLWIEMDDTHLLFDTGESDLFTLNAQKMQIDLTNVNALILSHGHYDHTGGMQSLYEMASPGIYLHSAASETRYSFHEEAYHNAAMPEEALKIVRDLPADKVHWIFAATKIAPGIGLTGPIPRLTDFEDTGGQFYLDEGMQQVDLIEDDMSIWFETAEGLVICTGCCHSGLINTLQYISQLSGMKKIRLIMGGLHLLDASDSRLQRTVEELKLYDIERIVPCHCTGERAIRYLQANLCCSVSPGYAGLEMSMD